MVFSLQLFLLPSNLFRICFRTSEFTFSEIFINSSSFLFFPLSLWEKWPSSFSSLFKRRVICHWIGNKLVPCCQGKSIWFPDTFFVIANSFHHENGRDEITSIHGACFNRGRSEKKYVFLFYSCERCVFSPATEYSGYHKAGGSLEAVIKKLCNSQTLLGLFIDYR